MRRRAGETFLIGPTPGADLSEPWPNGARVLGLRLEGADRLSPEAVGVLAIPGTVETGDRFYGLLPVVPIRHVQPWGEHRLQADRVRALIDPLLENVWDLGGELVEAETAWEEGKPCPLARLRVLFVVWRFLQAGGEATIEHRIGGQPEGRQRVDRVSSPQLLGGRNLGGMISGRRGALNIGWITAIRLGAA